MTEIGADPPAYPSEKSIFSKMIDGEIPADIVHKDEKCWAVRDISPQAPMHIILFPVKPISRLSESKEEDKILLGHLLYTAAQIARKEKLGAGYRVVINDGKNGGQSVYHLHVHILGGRVMNWPPG